MEYTKQTFTDGQKLYASQLNEIVNNHDSMNIVTPQQFGAKGDGVTDDGENMQKWFNYVIENGCCGLIPNGNYKIKKGNLQFINSNDLTNPAKKFSIVGESTNGVILDFCYTIGTDGRSPNHLAFVYLNNFSVKQLTIKCTGNSKQTYGTGLYLNLCKNANFKDINIINCTTCGVLAYVPTGTADFCDNLTFDNVNVYCIENTVSASNGYPWGWVLEGCTNTRVNNCYAEGTKWYTYEFKNDCDNSFFTNCIAKNCRIGCYTGLQGDHTGTKNCGFINITLFNCVQAIGGGVCNNCIFDIHFNHSSDYIASTTAYLIDVDTMKNSKINISSTYSYTYGIAHMQTNSTNNAIIYDGFNWKNSKSGGNPQKIAIGAFKDDDGNFTSSNNIIRFKSRPLDSTTSEWISTYSNTSGFGQNILIDDITGTVYDKYNTTSTS